MTQPLAVTRIAPARDGRTENVAVPLAETFFDARTPAPRSRTVGRTFALVLTRTVIVLRCLARTR